MVWARLHLKPISFDPAAIHEGEEDVRKTVTDGPSQLDVGEAPPQMAVVAQGLQAPPG